jgi:hypothetical protein
MRCAPVVLAIAVLAAGCGPTVQQQRAARLEAFQLELDSTLEQWRSDVGKRRFVTSADAARALNARYDLVYDRWGIPPDALAQAVMAYAVALATRVDRRDLSADEANALLSRMEADVARGRSAVGASRPHRAADRDAAMRSWWQDYWTANERTFRVAPRDPVRCETPPAGATPVPITCY